MHKRGIAAVPLLSKWCFVLGAAGRLAGGADADRRARGRRRVRQEEQEPAARRAGNVNVLFFIIFIAYRVGVQRCIWCNYFAIFNVCAPFLILFFIYICTPLTCICSLLQIATVQKNLVLLEKAGLVNSKDDYAAFIHGMSTHGANANAYTYACTCT